MRKIDKILSHSSKSILRDALIKTELMSRDTFAPTLLINIPCIFCRVEILQLPVYFSRFRRNVHIRRSYFLLFRVLKHTLFAHIISIRKPNGLQAGTTLLSTVLQMCSSTNYTMTPVTYHRDFRKIHITSNGILSSFVTILSCLFFFLV